jgi:hypothetical protein
VTIRGAPSAGRGLLSGETNLAALFHFLSKVTHGLLRDDASFAARKRGFGIIEGCQEFRSIALAFFPKQQCFLYRILGTVKPAGLDGSANECFLVGRQTYFHALKRKRPKSKCQASSVGFHNFRHSLASSLVKLKCDPKTVQGILRHEDARTTMQLYAQSDQESRLDAQGKFLALLLGDKAHVLTETIQ